MKSPEREKRTQRTENKPEPLFEDDYYEVAREMAQAFASQDTGWFFETLIEWSNEIYREAYLEGQEELWSQANESIEQIKSEG